jgi:5-formyltetrahydrofolate cyclo-ligase
MFYLSLPEEVNTEKMVRESRKMKKKIVVPISDVSKKKMILSVLKDYDRELGAGAFSVPEPKKRYIRRISSDVVDLVIVPGVAFDEKRGRLGFGRGFYDYFLKDLPARVLSVALAYDFQVLPELPLEKHDVPVDKIITERRVIENKKVLNCQSIKVSE